MTTSRRNYGWITDEIRAAAVQTVFNAIEAGLSLTAACAEVAPELKVHTNTVKNWVVASGSRSSASARLTNDQLLAVLRSIHE